MNELSVKKENELDIFIENGIGEVIKPLMNEIYLFDSFIAGTSHIEDKNIFDNLKENEELLLFREDNKFDEKAIKITNDKKEKLGYVPEKDNVVFSRLMDAGKLLKAKVKNIEKVKDFYKIAIKIYLVDI